MSTFATATLLVTIASIAYAAGVTTLVWREPWSDINQKRIQTAIVWLLPVFGAAVVHVILRALSQDATPGTAARGEPQVDQDVSPVDFEHMGQG